MAFLRENFTVLLLASFLFFFSGVTLLVFFKLGTNKDAVNWATVSFAGFQGALLGLVTGRLTAHIGASKEDSVVDNANQTSEENGK